MNVAFSHSTPVHFLTDKGKWVYVQANQKVVVSESDAEKLRAGIKREGASYTQTSEPTTFR